MYGIPKDFDLSPLMGSSIQSFSRSSNTISFHFENGWSITADGPIAIETKENSIEVLGSEKWSPMDALPELLDLVIRNWSVIDDRSFSILLENGISVIFHDNVSQYEVYHFSPCGWVL